MTGSVVDAMREGLSVVLIVAAPILLVGLGVSLIVSILQAMTQVQEQTISLVPRILAMLLAIVLLLDWMITRLSGFALDMFSGGMPA